MEEDDESNEEQDEDEKEEKRKIKKIKPKHVKKKTKRASVEKTGSKSSKKSTTWIWIVIALLIVIALGFLVFKIGYKKLKPGAENNEVVAVVNGESIYLSDINDQYDKLSPQYQQLFTKEMLLNQTIDEKLLLQKAKTEGITVDDLEVNNLIDKLLETNNITMDELTQKLQDQNLTIDYLKDIYRKQLTITKLLNETVLSGITVTDEEIQNFYDDNKNQFVVPEKVRARHIMIRITENFTEQQAFDKINMIREQLKTDYSNFCALVTKYSEDTGSIDNCGEYTFARGEMVSEFEIAAFNQSVNKTTIVKTQYGYHLIQTLEKIPESTTPFKDVKTKISDYLKTQKSDQEYNKFIQTLREEATIINYWSQKGTEATTQTPEITIGGETNTTEETTNTETATLTPEEIAKCLTEKGAKFYGAYWCGHCNNQKALFGDAFQYVTYVECANESNPQAQTQDCIDAGITGYPTWIINGKKYTGEQQLDELAKIAGC